MRLSRGIQREIERTTSKMKTRLRGKIANTLPLNCKYEKSYVQVAVITALVIYCLTAELLMDHRGLRFLATSL